MSQEEVRGTALHAPGGFGAVAFWESQAETKMGMLSDHSGGTVSIATNAELPAGVVPPEAVCGIPYQGQRETKCMANKGIIAVGFALALAVGCSKQPANQPLAPPPASGPAAAVPRSYQGVGVVKGLDPKLPAIMIDHEDIEADAGDGDGICSDGSRVVERTRR